MGVRCGEAGACKVPCFFPLRAFKAQGGGVTFRGGFVDRPVLLPCGQCRGCRAERARQWAIRCVHEAQMHARNCFITLTYNRESCPPDGGLRVEDFQKFCKRLRKSCGRFRFFHCGEYGEANKRPHYHACIFGLDFAVDRVLLRGSGQNRLYASGLLARSWGMGNCSVGELTYESAEYVARYCYKKITGSRAVDEYSRVDPVTGEVIRVAAPYVTMSRRPGVGSTWFEKFGAEVYPADEVVHKGRRFRPPRFYDGKIDPELLVELKAKRLARAADRKEELSPDRLRVRAECAEAKHERFARDL